VVPLLVATDGAIAAFGHDGRRLRPNIAVGGVEGWRSASGRAPACASARCCRKTHPLALDNLAKVIDER